MGSLESEVRREVKRASQTVYHLFQPTPLEPFAPNGFRIWFKREDLSPVHSYKWRGAFHALSRLPATLRVRGVVAASAGNHGQGLAASARHLSTSATIFMPEVTPQVKRAAVKDLGGDLVEVVIGGKSYDDASDLAKAYAAERKLPYLHPFDDIAVLGGNGTIGAEIIRGFQAENTAPDMAYLQIGGGGMAAVVALILREAFPRIRLVGVEGKHQASMKAAFAAGAPVTLSTVDSFCDGTAVKRVGNLPFELCRNLLDDLITVENHEVCEAISTLWQMKRVICEPSGALGFAGLWQDRKRLHGQNALVILTGANVDFAQLATISRACVQENPTV